MTSAHRPCALPYEMPCDGCPSRDVPIWAHLGAASIPRRLNENFHKPMSHNTKQATPNKDADQKLLTFVPTIGFLKRLHQNVTSRAPEACEQVFGPSTMSLPLATTTHRYQPPLFFPTTGPSALFLWNITSLSYSSPRTLPLNKEFWL